MNVLILGSGGREHAFAWKISQSPLLSNLYIAPGNPGTLSLGLNVKISPTDFYAIKEFVIAKKINLVVVGPEDPLVAGIHDFFLADKELKNIPVIGPTKAGAMLEGSKDFSKGFMMRHSIPTANYQSFKANQKTDAIAYLKSLHPPYVIKADGLAAGKGVIICNELSEAESSLTDFFSGKFGSAGDTVVIEEYLKGIEVSVFVLTDGESYVILPEAKDYKRIGEGDTGPNTGGMGAISPVPFVNREFMSKVEKQVIIPTINGLKSEKIQYKGFIFIGLMNVDGNPYVIEYNARMGDPETQAVLPRIKSDFLEILNLAAKNELHKAKVEFFDFVTAAVILVSGGYPNEYKKNLPISGLQPNNPDVITFHAGTTTDEFNNLITSGGRVFASVGISCSIPSALKYAYANANEICFDGKYFRKDIGRDLIT